MNLKNLIFLSIILTTFFGVNQNECLGQERPKNKGKFLPNTGTTSSFSANNKAQSRDRKVDILAEKIINTLLLNDSEARSIHDFCEDRSVKIEKIKLNDDNTQQKIADLQAVNQEFDQKIKLLVTPSQYQKYEAMRRAGN